MNKFISETVPFVTKTTNNYSWLADEMISDEDFVFGIKYLVEHRIIRV